MTNGYVIARRYDEAIFRKDQAIDRKLRKTKKTNPNSQTECA
jgi:hypothetical protein